MVMFSFLILGAAFVFLGRSYVISEYRGNMVSNAEEVSHAAQALVRDGELSNWDLRMVISTLAQSTGNHIFITDTDGTIVSCSCRNIACEHLGRTLTGSAMTQLRSDGKLNLITSLGGFYGSAHYVVAQPITIGTAARVVGYVFVATNSATIIDGWRTFVWVFLAASAAVMMIALLLSLVTSKRMAQPLDEMAVAAKKFAHGDFSTRVTDDGRTDEVGALISAFNTMADSLETSEQRRNAFIANVARAQDPHDHHRRLCRRHSRRHDPQGSGGQVPRHHRRRDAPALASRAQHARHVTSREHGRGFDAPARV